CVHRPDRGPDGAHEAAMIQADTGRVLFPLLPDGLHPALARLSELLRWIDGPVGDLRLLEVEHASAREFILESDDLHAKWALPGWDRLRAVGGEIAAVSALASQEDLGAGQPLLLSGGYESDALIQVSFLANAGQQRFRATATGSRGRVDLLFPTGWHGPAFLAWRDASGEHCEDAFPTWDPWPALVEVFEAAVGGGKPFPTPARI